MAEYLSPGVYIEEVNSGPRPIEGVGTAMAAFVGFAPDGPVNKPTLVTNWSQYVSTFGYAESENSPKDPHLDGAYLSHAVYGYFLNGGGRCYITRVGSAHGKAATLQIPSKASRSVAAFQLQAKPDVKGPIEVEVAPPVGDGPPEGSFTLKVKGADRQEVYENVSLGRGKGVKNVAEAVASASRLVAVMEAPGPAAALGDRFPELGTFALATKVTPGLPIGVSSAALRGDAGERTGVEGLEIAEDATMVCCPDLMSAYEKKLISREDVKSVQLAMIAHCERLGDRMAILDPLPDLSPEEVKAWRLKETNYDSKYAALYYPWIKVSGPKGPLMMPPSGHMAGVFARSDNERGVHKAPANEVVRGVLEVGVQVTKGEQDVLNPEGINCIRSFTGRGIRVWGARTLSSDPAWRYVNVRRLFSFVEKSIERGTQWVVFEPNDPDLWARVRRDVKAFLTTVWRSGALFGTTADQAFFVKCDEEINPSETRDVGQLVIEIGLAPVKPAEFVIFRLSQMSGGGA